jgi:hypothetical protein
MSRPTPQDDDTPIFNKLAAERGYNSMIVKATTYDSSSINLPYAEDNATVVFAKVEEDKPENDNETPTQTMAVIPLWEVREE